MTARDFCYWLQGYFEIDRGRFGDRAMTAEQADMIRRHLSLVFAHDIDPKAGGEDVQKVLNDLHGVAFTTNPNVQVRC